MNVSSCTAAACPVVPNQQVDPFFMVVFGGGGDLSRKQLIPSVFRLFQGGNIKQFSAVGIGRTVYTDDQYREKLKKNVQHKLQSEFQLDVWRRFEKNIFYRSANIDNPELYQQLCQRINAFKKQYPINSIIHYLAVQPSLVETIVNALLYAGLCRQEKTAKIVIEKPFGHDQDSARALNAKLSEAFDEDQIYRIDHYLGKETVQNILFFRFANNIFEPLWNQNYISHIQITVAESIGIENRGAFYEEAGVIRDMVQNHIMQLLALVSMEPPVSFDAQFIRDEKVKALKSIRILHADELKKHMVIGQYTRGTVKHEPAAGYREEINVNPQSHVPTYFAGKFLIDNWRFSGVPIYVRSGKRLARHLTQIIIQFKHPPLKLLEKTCGIMDPNCLIITIAPHEQIALRFGVKSPGSLNCTYPVNMLFDYQQAFKTVFYSPYERLLLDCMKGDLTLFARHDGIDAMWGIIDPVVACAEDSMKDDVCFLYPAGTWGPEQANYFIEKDGYRWLDE
jgi:glucose-6-phosphate 1-dehydrogenase